MVGECSWQFFATLKKNMYTNFGHKHLFGTAVVLLMMKIMLWFRIPREYSLAGS